MLPVTVQQFVWKLKISHVGLCRSACSSIFHPATSTLAACCSWAGSTAAIWFSRLTFKRGNSSHEQSAALKMNISRDHTLSIQDESLSVLVTPPATRRRPLDRSAAAVQSRAALVSQALLQMSVAVSNASMEEPLEHLPPTRIVQPARHNHNYKTLAIIHNWCTEVSFVLQTQKPMSITRKVSWVNKRQCQVNTRTRRQKCVQKGVLLIKTTYIFIHVDIANFQDLFRYRHHKGFCP